MLVTGPYRPMFISRFVELADICWSNKKDTIFDLHFWNGKDATCPKQTLLFIIVFIKLLTPPVTWFYAIIVRIQPLTRP